MQNTINWIHSIVSLCKEFMTDMAKKADYQIVDIYECPKTKFTKAEIKLSGRHIIDRNISDIVMDLSFLENFDKKTIRTLTYIATVERLKPDYSIVIQQLGSEVDDYILEIRSRNGKNVAKKSPSDMSKDKLLLAKFSPVDANRIGYLAGIKDTVKEFQLKPKELE